MVSYYKQGWYDPNQIQVVPNTGTKIDRNAWSGISLPSSVSGYQPDPLNAPTRTTAGTAYENIKSLLPNQGVYQPISFTPISGLGDDYYKSLEDKATKSLRSQYFDDDNSILNQFNQTANQRGILGSGLEVGGLNQIYKDFGTQLAGVGSDIARTKAEKDYEVAVKNAEMGQQNAFQNQQGQFSLAQLGLGSALDEASNATKFDTDMFEQSVNYEKVLSDLEKSKRETLTSLLDNKNLVNNQDDLLKEIFLSLGITP